MARLCEFITPARESTMKPTCPDNFFRSFHEKNNCSFCPKAVGFNNGVAPRSDAAKLIAQEFQAGYRDWLLIQQGKRHRRNYRD